MNVIGQILQKRLPLTNIQTLACLGSYHTFSRIESVDNYDARIRISGAHIIDVPPSTFIYQN